MSVEALDKRFADLQDRLTALQDATDQLKGLIDRLASFNFQPGSVPLTAGPEDEHVGTELSSEINQVLREQEEELEVLQEEIVDFPVKKQHDKDRLEDSATRLVEELQICRRYFRKAQLAAKQNLELAQREERKALYSSFSADRSIAPSPAASTTNLEPAGNAESSSTAPPPPSHQEARALLLRRRPGGQRNRSLLSKDDQTIGASDDVTQSLRQTYDLMATELSRSDYAHRTLRESTQALTSLSETYTDLGAMLATSRDLLGTLLRSQKSDTWYLESSFYLLAGTLAWLIFRRWFYGPAWWLVWLPLRLMFGVGWGASKAAVGAFREDAAQNTIVIDGSQGQQQTVSMNVDGLPSTQKQAENTKDDDDDTMVEKVGRMMDEAQDGKYHDGDDEEGAGTVLRDRVEGEDGPPNPKKRVMATEEDGSRQQARVRDEL